MCGLGLERMKCCGGRSEKATTPFTEKNWKKTRDLALLALISYQPQNQEEKDVLTAATEEGEDIE